MDAVQVGELWAGKAEPILPSASLPRTLEFWKGLGFSTGVWEDDEGYAWVYPGDDATSGIHIDYNLSEDLDPFASFGMAYLTVPDVESIYRAVAAAGIAFEALDDDGLFRYNMRELREMWERGDSLARYTRPIDQSWGKRELALFDPDNNLIRIGSAL
jgi:catechol 2,3-dioxygenase-like lactoylglutathione lyase family enzyme